MELALTPAAMARYVALGASPALFDAIYKHNANTHRIVCIDDSLSTRQAGHDGRARWEEITEIVGRLAQLTVDLGSTISLMRLNRPGYYAEVKDLLLDPPGGGTPLVRRLKEIGANLTRREKRVVIIILTDGSPDGPREDFIDAIREITAHGAEVIVRLCTDDDEVAEFYNGAEEENELGMDVILHYEAECDEVMSHNEWLNYTRALHYLREFGALPFPFSEIDSRALTPVEKASVIAMVGTGEGYNATLDRTAPLVIANRCAWFYWPEFIIVAVWLAFML
jgi:hypothetical protein